MYDRLKINEIATAADIDKMNLSDAALSHDAIMLLGFQRTKQISRKSRLRWKEGNPAPLSAEAKARRREIFDGALLEIYQEHLPLRAYLRKRRIKPGRVIDIGCGQALNDLFLHRDYKSHFTLVDIEETPRQYHAWSADGSGYASLADARALLHANGVARTKVVTINPRKEPEALGGVRADLVTSLYSCGFHYPLDEYVPLFTRTIEAGGTVCVDLRNNYIDRDPDSAGQLLDLGRVTVIYEDDKSKRVAVKK